MISCKEYVAQEKERLKEIIKTDAKNDIKYELHIFQVGDNPASNSYIKSKLKDCTELGINGVLHKFDDKITTQDLISDYVKSCVGKQCGVIFQLPMPKHINVNRIIEELSMSHDVDGFKYNSKFNPCTPGGIMDWLEFNKVKLSGKNVCIIGRSDIVGKPLAKLMLDKDATVTVCHSKTKNLEEHMKIADIIVSAVGEPKFIHDVNLPKRPIMIDVGINRDENGKLCGDIDYDNMKDTCGYITPVPGGVGKLTVFKLLSNVVDTKNFYK